MYRDASGNRLCGMPHNRICRVNKSGEVLTSQAEAGASAILYSGSEFCRRFIHSAMGCREYSGAIAGGGSCALGRPNGSGCREEPVTACVLAHIASERNGRDSYSGSSGIFRVLARLSLDEEDIWDAGSAVSDKTCCACRADCWPWLYPIMYTSSACCCRS